MGSKRYLLAQEVSNRHDEVTAELICSFAALIFDAVVASAVCKLPVFEFSITVMNHFSTNPSAKKII